MTTTYQMKHWSKAIAWEPRPAWAQLFDNCLVGDGCWEFQGKLQSGGYSDIVVGGRKNGKHVLGHRLAYATFVGPIPEGYQIDHLCSNRRCVRPSHLEAVTPRVNNLRSTGIAANNARKTECHNGHPLSGDNLYTAPKTGSRDCRICRRTARRAYEARRSA